ncbi:MAG: hypothetical protein PHR45_09540 [Muribaculaceae bacterium]|nr:hypothetical protein [Muribaculaceae bacterium]
MQKDMRVGEDYIKVEPKDYRVLSENLISRYGNKTVYGCVAFTADNYYLCDYFGEDGARAKSKFIIVADEGTTKTFNDEVSKRNNLNAENLNKLLATASDRAARNLSRSSNAENGRRVGGDELVSSRQFGEVQEAGHRRDTSRDNGQDGGNIRPSYTEVKTGYDGSSKPRVIFIDENNEPLYRDGDEGASKGASREEIAEEAESVGSYYGEKVKVVSRDEIMADTTLSAEERKLRASKKGWYNPKTGETVIVAENASSAGDARYTALHEVLGHKGMAEMLG